MGFTDVYRMMMGWLGSSSATPGPFRSVAGQAWSPGSERAQAYSPGSVAGQGHTPGSEKGQGL